MVHRAWPSGAGPQAVAIIMASALPSTFRRAWSEFSLRFRVMTELSPSTLNFLTMFATVPMLIPCDLAQSACFKTGGWASSKSSNILHLLARVSFVDLLRSILLSNETSSSDRLTEYDFGLAIVASPLVVSDGRKYITGLYKCQCVESLVAGEIEFAQAMAELQVGKTRLYELKASFLAARAAGAADSWVPGTSGGDHAAPWPEEEQRFLRRVLSPCGDTKRYSYAFAASELGRLFGHSVDRGQVRHWAIDHGIKIAVPKPRPPAHVRRWQRRSVGELWQLDATPDRFLGGDGPVYQLLDMLDDCSRVQVGCRLYARECVPSYLDMFYGAFSRYGLPLEIYVDKAGFFRGENGELTQLGRRLKFFDISFVFANSPESKGKIERVHLVWQDRLPAYFGREGIGPDTPLQTLNEHVASLVDHRNGFEVHREIGMTPDAAWNMAVREGRCKLRPVPQDGWWELVWSEWSRVTVGLRGRVLLDGRFCPTECASGTRVWLCRHIDGTVSVVLNKPERRERPVILFSNNPRVRKP